MKSLKNVTIISKRRKNLYGVFFIVDGYRTEIYNITKIPSDLNDRYSDSEYCWVEWVIEGITHGVEYDKEEVIGNFKDGSWIKV